MIKIKLPHFGEIKFFEKIRERFFDSIEKKKRSLLNDKLDIEKDLRSKITAWHTKIINRICKDTLESKLSIMVNVTLEQAERNEFEQILQDNLVVVIDKIQPKNFRKDTGNPDFDQIVAHIKDSFLSMSDRRVKEDAKKICDTTQDVLIKISYMAVQSSVDLAVSEQRQVTTREIVLSFKRLAERALNNRLSLLCVSETNWMVEGFRYIKEMKIAEQSASIVERWADQYAGKSLMEMLRKEELSDEDNEYLLLLLLRDSSERESMPDLIGQASDAVGQRDTMGAYGIARQLKQLMKEWFAVLDKKTRDTHRYVSGTIIKATEAFLVGAYEMMYPSDNSLGAGAEEIANCRCGVIYI